MVSAVLCFDGVLRGEVGVVGFRVARVVFVDTEFIPIVTIVADEVGDFAEGLVRYGVL